jgi:hypothetical protein
MEVVAETVGGGGWSASAAAGFANLSMADLHRGG